MILNLYGVRWWFRAAELDCVSLSYLQALLLCDHPRFAFPENVDWYPVSCSFDVAELLLQDSLSVPWQR